MDYLSNLSEIGNIGHFISLNSCNYCNILFRINIFPKEDHGIVGFIQLIFQWEIISMFTVDK